MNKSSVLMLTLLTTSACSLAPDFTLPKTDLPTAYKEQSAKDEVAPQGQWKPAESLEKADRGQWWKIFDDASLDELEEQATKANQSLKAASSRVEQARAMAEANTPSFLPDIGIGGNAVRAQPSSASVAAFGGASGMQLKPYTLYSAQGVATYEADLFGRVRDNYRAYSFDADAQEASYRSALLALQADVAQHYFTLRALDTERQLLRDTVKIREEAARIMQRRFSVGEAGEQDKSRTEGELAAVKADLIMLDRRRAATEHALAVLLGKMPSEFSSAEAPLGAIPPEIPAGIPSSLLERRPDIATAQSMMAAANKRIGVARTAFFPSLSLTASGGFESTDLGDLFQWSSRTWALGQFASALSMTILDSGRNLSKLDQAESSYHETVANYRQQVLVAFRDVEDNLTDQRLLAEQSREQDNAAAAASKTTELAEKRYQEGEADYFEVVDAQRTSLSAERGALQTRGQRFITTVTLIRALGGGWDMPVRATPVVEEPSK